MTGICICCARYASIQRHHPGRRKFTSITVPACQDCHTVLTIWDGGIHGQRHWNAQTEPIIRVRAGIADILHLASLRSGWPDIADSAEQIISDYASLFTVRYSASDTAYDISEISPDNRQQQIAEIRTMIGAYLACR